MQFRVKVSLDQKAVHERVQTLMMFWFFPSLLLVLVPLIFSIRVILSSYRPSFFLLSFFLPFFFSSVLFPFNIFRLFLSYSTLSFSSPFLFLDKQTSCEAALLTFSTSNFYTLAKQILKALLLFLLQHPFIREMSDNQPLIDLYRLMNTEVVEVLEDLPEDKDVSR